LLAPMVTLNSAEVVELLGDCGYDWLFIDAEHSPMEPRDIQPLLQASSVPCMIRIKDSSVTTIKKALDLGPAGLIVPQVNSGEQAEAVVAASRYNGGVRGVGLARAHGYGTSFVEYIEKADTAHAVVVQAEHHLAVANIDAIASTDGVDGVLVGPYDLSSSMGLIGQVDHPDVQAAIKSVREACQRHSKALGFFGVGAEAVQPAISDGYTFITVGVDTMMLATAAQKMVRTIRDYVQ
ncbi:MAG: aldolase/citrate lyase family protein, partial [Chloroflexi bacterium]|nr:aldolase/citrate lyase family protein [Chloroflexota bacterium]